MTTKVIVLRESWRESFARDAGSVVAAFTLMTPGWWFQMWGVSAIGAVLFCMAMAFRASGLRRSMEKTLEEARAEIDSMIAERDATK